MRTWGASRSRAASPIERWHRATKACDFDERDRLLARARELGAGHRDAAQILAAYADEQARINAELTRWRNERPRIGLTSEPAVERSAQPVTAVPPMAAKTRRSLGSRPIRTTA